jgi:7,8-dihydropterin-6-yl-methyl-4-(beta-D-ribofuranosyl)aminobenzene 5'-phosphate synthase
VEEMKKIGPDFIAMTHCTDWKAINDFAREMPDQFILNCVGTTYLFDSL